MSLVYLSDGLSNLSYTNKKQILVVEDQPHAQEVARSLFDNNICDVTTVYNISEALLACQQVTYDLIVIDWVLQEGNASELLAYMDKNKAIKYKDKLKRKPFVIFTGKSPESISLPHITNLQLVDFWQKNQNLLSLAKRATSLVKRIERGAL